MKTIVLKPAEVTPQWWVVDATDLVVGRLAVKVAPILMGKHRPDYTPHVDSGNFVIVINAEKVRFTGRKWEQKTYEYYTGYSSGRRIVSAASLHERKPEQIVRLAVKRMLPKNKLANVLINHLKVFAGPNHPHQAQQPKELKLEL